MQYFDTYIKHHPIMLVIPARGHQTMCFGRSWLTRANPGIQTIGSWAKQSGYLGLGTQAQVPRLTTANPGIQAIGSRARQCTNPGFGPQARVPTLTTANPGIQTIGGWATQFSYLGLGTQAEDGKSCHTG